MTPDHLLNSIVLGRKPCARTPGEPRGYVDWHNWATEKSKTHVQRLCRRCKLWHIWVDKKWEAKRKKR